MKHTRRFDTLDRNACAPRPKLQHERLRVTTACAHWLRKPRLAPKRLNRDVMRHRLMLTGSTLRPRSDEFKALLADEIARNVWPLVADGMLRPVMDRIFRMADASSAHARMEAGDHIGKIVLKVA